MRVSLVSIAMVGGGLVAGCSFSAQSNPAAGDDTGPAIDAPAGDAPTTPDAMVEPVCLGAITRLCVPPPASTLRLMTQRIDTTSSTLCTSYSGAPGLCVISAQTITIPAGSTVT